MPKTKEQLYHVAEQAIMFVRDDWDIPPDAEIAKAVVDALLEELNITLAPIVGETKR